MIHTICATSATIIAIFITRTTESMPDPLKSPCCAGQYESEEGKRHKKHCGVYYDHYRYDSKGDEQDIFPERVRHCSFFLCCRSTRRISQVLGYLVASSSARGATVPQDWIRQYVPHRPTHGETPSTAPRLVMDRYGFEGVFDGALRDRAHHFVQRSGRPHDNVVDSQLVAD